MPILALHSSLSSEAAVGAASAQFTLSMITTQPLGFALYQFVSNTACWISQGASPTASAGAGSAFIPANVVVVIDGQLGAKLAVIQDAVAGKASLTPLLRVA